MRIILVRWLLLNEFWFSFHSFQRPSNWMMIWWLIEISELYMLMKQRIYVVVVVVLFSFIFVQSYWWFTFYWIVLYHWIRQYSEILPINAQFNSIIIVETKISLAKGILDQIDNDFMSGGEIHIIQKFWDKVLKRSDEMFINWTRII